MDDKRTSQHIQLRDERRLGYAEFGPTDGVPVFYFHGFPGSRVDWGLIHANNLLNCHAKFHTNKGHLTLPPHHLKEIMRVLVA